MSIRTNRSTLSVDSLCTKSYCTWRRSSNLSQVEYITMFIKSVSVAEVSDPSDTLTASLEDMTYNERVQIIDSMPQSILFDDNTGIVSKVIAEFVEPMNEVFKYRDCAFCGAAQDGQVANLTDFLGG